MEIILTGDLLVFLKGSFSTGHGSVDKDALIA